MAIMVRDPHFATTMQSIATAEAASKANDWANLCRYKKDDITQMAKGQPQVVFLGDSITENWTVADHSLFTDGMAGRGIGGQNTSQILLRLMADVVALPPQAVHIMAGTNDVAGNGGPIGDDDIVNNIEAMVLLAKAGRIAVVLAAIPPASSMPWRPNLKPAERITALNVRLKALAQKLGAVFVDYTPALTDGHGGILQALSNDGVHPNRTGYAAMLPIARRALAGAGVR